MSKTSIFGKEIKQFYHDEFECQKISIFAKNLE